MTGTKSLVIATTSRITVNFTKSTTKIDTYVGFAKLNGDTRPKVVIMTTAEKLKDGEYKVQLANMPRGNGYVVTYATSTTVIKLSDTLSEKTGAEILKMAGAGKFFYAALFYGKVSGRTVKPQEIDVINLHNFITPTKKYWTVIDAQEKCFIATEKTLSGFINPTISTFETVVELCKPC